MYLCTCIICISGLVPTHTHAYILLVYPAVMNLEIHKPTTAGVNDLGMNATLVDLAHTIIRYIP